MPNLPETAKTAPSSPGVYIFRNSSGVPIYIGKAKNIRNRVSSYFGSDLLDRTQQMVQSARTLEFIVTDSEAEALLLESNLIKQHYPKYNIDLKDNEKFTYILITDEEYPRMLLVRKNRAGRVAGGKGKLFGPFLSGSAYVLVASTLRKIFKLRTCRLGQKRPCLQYHLGFCTGVCAGLVTRKEYMEQVEKLRSVLSGGKKLGQVMEDMGREMKEAAKKRQFERALALRNSIRSLSSLLERQKFEREGEGNEDFISLLSHQGKTYAQLFMQINGVIRDRRKYEFISLSGDPLSEFLPRFYEAGGIPRRIYVESEPESKSALENYLSGKRSGAVSILSPEKGDKKKLLDLLRKNILLEISGTADPALLELQRALSLPTIPRVIECFDISNLFGTSVVGSMVQLVNGKPNKSAYRRFRIRTVEGQDDFASMREIVLRRYYRLKLERAQLPDLVVIDGGPGQLSAALSALSELQLEIPVVSLAKEFEEIYSPERALPLRLPRSSSALQCLQHARDEAHRFGISYHRLLRKKKFGESS